MSQDKRKDTVHTVHTLVGHEGTHHQHHGHGHHAHVSFPVSLIVFVVILAVIGGFVVVGVHYSILYAGCPLGLNGCNSFHKDKEKKGFFLLRACKNLFGPEFPEDVAYVVCAAMGASFVALMFTKLPHSLSTQIRGGGTIQSLVAVATGDGIPATAALMRVIVSSVYLGSGGTLGMEGPAIQACVSCTTLFGWVVGMRAIPTQSLLASLGFACGFAASFNSPLAGILFAMEELQHVSNRLSTNIIYIILVASTVSTAVARGCSGNKNLMQAGLSQDLKDSVSGGSLDSVFGQHMWMLIAIPIGALSSVAGFLVTKSITWLYVRIRKCRTVVPEALAFVLQAVLAAIVGAVVFRITGLRGVWGVGYESMQKAFETEFTALEYLIFALGKTIAMILGISVQGPGDLLEPILISGGFFGGFIGVVMKHIITNDTLAEQVLKPCILFGMSSMFASCFRFPLTPVVIVLEMMGLETYSLILPVFFGCLTASLISSRFFDPLLDELMRVGGVDLHILALEADARAAEQEEELMQRRSSEQSSESGTSSDSPLERNQSHSSLHSNASRLVHSIEDAVLTLSMQQSGVGMHHHHHHHHHHHQPDSHHAGHHNCASRECEQPPRTSPSHRTCGALSTLGTPGTPRSVVKSEIRQRARSDSVVDFRSPDKLELETQRSLSDSVVTQYPTFVEGTSQYSEESDGTHQTASEEKTAHEKIIGTCNKGESPGTGASLSTTADATEFLETEACPIQLNLGPKLDFIDEDDGDDLPMLDIPHETHAGFTSHCSCFPEANRCLAIITPTQSAAPKSAIP